jgi:hypothetical protein
MQYPLILRVALAVEAIYQALAPPFDSEKFHSIFALEVLTTLIGVGSNTKAWVPAA